VQASGKGFCGQSAASPTGGNLCCLVEYHPAFEHSDEVGLWESDGVSIGRRQRSKGSRQLPRTRSVEALQRRQRGLRGTTRSSESGSGSGGHPEPRTRRYTFPLAWREHPQRPHLMTAAKSDELATSRCWVLSTALTVLDRPMRTNAKGTATIAVRPHTQRANVKPLVRAAEVE
jgi:hypothetical protein